MNNLGILLAAQATQAAETVEVSNGMAVVIGVGTVFVGLIVIVLICKVMGALCSLTQKKAVANIPASSVAAQAASPVITNRGELAAAISAAVAEELGTDVSGIRIVSIKKV